MTVILDPECSFEDLIAELAAKFKDSARFWGNAQMALLLQGRPLTTAQEMQIVNTITENSGIEGLRSSLPRLAVCFVVPPDSRFLELYAITGMEQQSMDQPLEMYF